MINLLFLKRTSILFFSVFCMALFVNTRTDSSNDKKVSTKPSGDTVSARKLFDRADMLSKTGKFDSAVIAYTSAGIIYQRENQFEKYAQCQNKISEQFINTGRFDQGRMFADKALKISLQSNAMKEAGGSYCNIGVICLSVGKPDSAKYYFQKALAIWLKDKGENQLCVTEVYANLAFLLFQMEEYNESMQMIRKAISITGKLHGNFDDNIAYYYNTVGAISQKTGDFPTAISVYKKAIGIWYPKYGDGHPLIGALYNNIGELDWEIGNYSEASIYLGKAISILEATGGTSGQQVAAAYHNAACVQIRMKDMPTALSYMKSALRIWKLKGGQPIQVGLSLNNMGRIYMDLQKYDSAWYYYKTGIALIETYNKISPDLSTIYTNLGLLYLNSKNYDKSETFLQKAIAIFQSNSAGNHPPMPVLYYNLGNFYFERKNYAEALRYFQKAIMINVAGFNDTDATHNPIISNVYDKLALLFSLEGKSDVFFVKYYQQPDSLQFLKKAMATMELATQLADSIRVENKLENTQFSIDRQILPYPNAIEFSYILYHRTGDPAYLEKAFFFSEKSRGAALYSSMKELSARNIGGIPDSVQEIERSVHVGMAFYKKCIQDEKLTKNPDMKKISLWEKLQFKLNGTADSLKKAFERSYPEYYHLKYDRQIASIKDVQKSLKVDEVLMEYANTKNKLITFIITPSTVSMISSPIDGRFDQNIDEFRKMILHKNVSDSSVAEFCAVSGYLYDKLLKNAAPLLKGKKLIIIPDGKLGTIPFEALINRQAIADQANFQSLPYLVRSHDIGYGYSATIFLNSLTPKSNHPESSILAFAPSFAKGNKILLAELSERGAEYVDLVGSKQEVKNIEQEFGGKVFIDTAATKKNFLDYSPKYNILHISTHGIMNDAKPMESKLVFFQKNDTSDANLYAYELFNMKLNASLVVLSACNTGFGKIADGEGIMSLSRGFTYAGVPAVVSTLWSVNDRSTAIIMKDFYQHLGEREAKTSALRNAQLDYLTGADQITAHPFYWAGFIAIGNNNPVLGSTRFLRWGLPMAIIVLILFGIYRFRKTRKKSVA